jgi:hypothetical protein
MVKNGDQIEKLFFQSYIKSDLYATSITEKFKMLISKGFCLKIILEIMKNLRNYGRHGRGGYLKF